MELWMNWKWHTKGNIWWCKKVNKRHNSKFWYLFHTLIHYHCNLGTVASGFSGYRITRIQDYPGHQHNSLTCTSTLEIFNIQWRRLLTAAPPPVRIQPVQKWTGGVGGFIILIVTHNFWFCWYQIKVEIVNFIIWWPIFTNKSLFFIILFTTHWW